MENNEKVIETVAGVKEGINNLRIERLEIISSTAILVAAVSIGFLWCHRRGFKQGRRITACNRGCARNDIEE